MHFQGIFCPLYLVKIEWVKHFCFYKMVQLIYKKGKTNFQWPKYQPIWSHPYVGVAPLLLPLLPPSKWVFYYYKRANQT